MTTLQDKYNTVLTKIKHNEYISQEEINEIDKALGELERLQKREVPMKPILGTDNRGRLDCLCSNCSRDVALDEKYCSHCGQRLDWSDEK